MAEELLDHEAIPKEFTYYDESLKKAKIAWAFFIGTWGAVFLGFFLGFENKFGVFLLTMATPIPLLIALSFSMWGFFKIIQSYLVQEDYGFKRHLVMISNLLIFGSFILLILSEMFRHQDV